MLKLRNMLKTCFLTKNAFFYPNHRTLNMYAHASFGFGFRSLITRNDKKNLCICQNHVFVEFHQTNISTKPYPISIEHLVAEIIIITSLKFKNNAKNKNLSPLKTCNSKSIFLTSDSFPLIISHNLYITLFKHC